VPKLEDAFEGAPAIPRYTNLGFVLYLPFSLAYLSPFLVSVFSFATMRRVALQQRTADSDAISFSSGRFYIIGG